MMTVRFAKMHLSHLVSFMFPTRGIHIQTKLIFLILIEKKSSSKRNNASFYGDKGIPQTLNADFFCKELKTH